MTPIAVVLLAAAIFGGVVGAAVQRTRTAFTTWRKTVAAIPVLRGAFAAQARHATLLLAIGAVVVLALMAS